MRRRLGRWLLRLVGWRIEGELPSEGTFLVIGAPHTSNWDLPLGLAAAAAFGVRISWLGKASLFRWPIRGLMSRLGGIPIQRERSEGVVKQAAEALTESESLVLVIAPEGTRSHTSFWKSGFYHIATAAQVPIVPVCIDRSSRRIVAGEPLHVTGNIHQDMGIIRDFFAGMRGIRSGRAGPVELEDER